MKYASEEELEALKESEKDEWEHMHVYAYSAEAGGGYGCQPPLNEVKAIMFQCLRCNAHFLLEECPNCGSTSFAATTSGVYCGRCDRGFSSWTCNKCETQNPAIKTFFGLATKKSGCFIATAVYGTSDAPEVRALRAWRDQHLMTTWPGRFLVRAYYRVGPSMARVVHHTPYLGAFLRAAVFGPIAQSLTGHKNGRNQNEQ